MTEDMLGDKSFAELGLEIEQDYQSPVAPPTRDKTMVIPGRAGAWDFGADSGPRPFSLPVHLIENSTAGLQTAIRKVSSHLYDSYGNPKTMKLILSEEPDIYYLVRYSGSLPVSRIIDIGKFSLPLMAFDPHGYAESTAYDPDPVPQYDTGLQYDSGLMYPNPTSFDWLYSTQYCGLYNYANLNSPVRILINGSVINPRIMNQTTGKMLTISVTNGPNDLLVIDAKRFYVLKSTPNYETYFLSTTFPAGFMDKTESVNIFDNKYGDDDLFLAPGKNSLLFEGGIPAASVQIIWHHQYL